KFDWHINVSRYVRLANVELLEQRREKLARMECALRRAVTRCVSARSIGCRKIRQVFPEEFSPVKHTSASHVKQIYRQHVIFEVVTKHVGVIAFDRSDALLLLQLLDSRDQVAIFGGSLILLGLSSFRHAL